MVRRALLSGRFGSYTVATTDWAQIVRLYDMLLSANPSPVVELNRGIAVAMADGAEAGLVLVDALLQRGELADYGPAHAARADLNRRLGRTAEALSSYRRALDLIAQESERHYLRRHIAEIAA